MTVMAAVYADLGLDKLAAQLLAVGIREFEELGMDPTPDVTEHVRSVLRSRIGEDRFCELVGAARTLPVDEAVASALQADVEREHDALGSWLGTLQV